MRNNQNRLGPSAVPSVQSAAASAPNLNFVVPTEFVELPSRGRFYPNDHPLHNQETVEIKFMTAKEEDILASSTLLKKGLIIDRLLENIIIVDVDPVTLLVGDRNAIMIAARISSYGPAYKADVVCTSCNNNQEYDFDLKKASINNNCFDEKYLKNNNINFNNEKNNYELILPISEVKLGIRMLSGADEKNSISEKEDENIITFVLSKFIISVNDSEDPQLISQFVDNMLAADSRYMRRLLPELAPNIDLTQKFVCKHCKTEEDLEVPLTAEFFWPE